MELVALCVEPLSGDGALALVLGAALVVDSSVGENSDVLGLQLPLADLADGIVTNDQVGGAQVVELVLRVELLHLGETLGDGGVLLDGERVVED